MDASDRYSAVPRFEVAGTHPLLRWFDHGHLPAEVQPFSRAPGDVARYMVASLPHSAELTAGLRKLLEAKDCFVRAALAAQEISRPAGLPMEPE